MTPDAVLVLGVLALTVVGLAVDILSPDVLLVGALAALMALGVVDVETALRGLSNPALVTIGGLFIVAAGLRATRALEKVAPTVLGRSGHLRPSLARLTATVAGSSAFISNPALVAMGIPAVTSRARRHGIPVSRILIPLSYASILGGVCTLLGTFTNLVADGLLRTHGLAGLGFFELGVVGVPLIVVGVASLSLVGPALLPDRSPAKTPEEQAREYVADMRVPPGSRLEGRTVEEAGLRSLPGLLFGPHRAGGGHGGAGHARRTAGGRGPASGRPTSGPATTRR